MPSRRCRTSSASARRPREAERLPSGAAPPDPRDGRLEARELVARVERILGDAPSDPVALEAHARQATHATIAVLHVWAGRWDAAAARVEVAAREARGLRRAAWRALARELTDDGARAARRRSAS